MNFEQLQQNNKHENGEKYVMSFTTCILHPVLLLGLLSQEDVAHTWGKLGMHTTLRKEGLLGYCTV
jgi:hypothetical protein